MRIITALTEVHFYNTTNSRASKNMVVFGRGGTIGSPTTPRLIRSGYTLSNITVLNVYSIPSAQSARHSLDEIMSVRLRNKLDLKLSLEVLNMQNNDALF